jgi:hypothetical protein
MVAQNVSRYMKAEAGLEWEANLLRDDRKWKGGQYGGLVAQSMKR